MSKKALWDAIYDVEGFQNISIDIELENNIVLKGIVVEGNKSESISLDEYDRNQIHNIRKAIDEKIQQILEDGENARIVKGNISFYVLLRHSRALRHSLLNQGRTKELADMIRNIHRNKIEEQRR